MQRNLIILISILLLIQLIRIDITPKASDNSRDFLVQSGADKKLSDRIKAACYDCHSYETTYPWYAQVAPVSWWIANHINEGREHLNFSEWTAYDSEKQKHKLEESIEMIQNGEMPVKSFTWLHPEARMSHEQKEELIGFFNKWYGAL